jgi:hypothetical protein
MVVLKVMMDSDDILMLADPQLNVNLILEGLDVFLLHVDLGLDFACSVLFIIRVFVVHSLLLENNLSDFTE